jgi:hypothetical protein
LIPGAHTRILNVVYKSLKYKKKELPRRRSLYRGPEKSGFGEILLTDSKKGDIF